MTESNTEQRDAAEVGRMHSTWLFLQTVYRQIPTWALVASALLLASFHTYRTFQRCNIPGSEDRFENRGFVDFHNAIYFPVRTFLSGQNPYSLQYVADHPDHEEFPLFPPHTLIFHLPFAWGNLAVSRYLYFGFQAVLFGVMAVWLLKRNGYAVNIRSLSLLASAVMLTVPFYSQVYLGQLTFQLALAAWVALDQASRRPTVAGIALSVLAIKPQFVVPLSILLLCRRQWKAVLYGATLSVLLVGLAFGWIAWNVGVTTLASDIRETYFSTFQTHPALGLASENYRRIDLFPLFARIWGDDLSGVTKGLISLTVLGTGAATIYLLGKPGRCKCCDWLSNSVICLTTLLCIYHSVYDGLLLLLPVSVAVLQPRRCPGWLSAILLFAMAAVLWDVFALVRVLEKLGCADTRSLPGIMATTFAAVAMSLALLASFLFAAIRKAETE